MFIVWTVLYWILFLYLLLFIGRMILSWIQAFSPNWRPQGAMLLVAEVVYTPTDPPLRAVGKFVPPLNLGGIRLDLGFIIVVMLLWILLQVVGGFVRASA